MWYIYSVEFYSAIKRSISESVLMRRMNQEPIKQSKVSQKEKDKYRILMHMYGIWKEGTDEPICKAAVEMQTQRMDLWTQWGKMRVGRIERVALRCMHYHV